MEAQPPNGSLQPRSPDLGRPPQSHLESVKVPEPVTLNQLHQRLVDLAKKTEGKAIKGDQFYLTFSGRGVDPDQGFREVGFHIQEYPRLATGVFGAGGTTEFSPPVESYTITNDGIWPKAIRRLPSTNTAIVQALNDRKNVDPETTKELVQSLSRFLDDQDIRPDQSRLEAMGFGDAEAALKRFGTKLGNSFRRKGTQT